MGYFVGGVHLPLGGKKKFPPALKTFVKGVKNIFVFVFNKITGKPGSGISQKRAQIITDVFCLGGSLGKGFGVIHRLLIFGADRKPVCFHIKNVLNIVRQIDPQGLQPD